MLWFYELPPLEERCMADSALKQTTYRVDPELLRQARLLLDRQKKTVNDYIVEQLAELVAQDAQDHARQRRETTPA